MKAKIKPLIILIAIFALSLVAGIAAGCSIGEKTMKDTAEEHGCTCPVTYYANGGQFTLGGDDEKQVYKTVLYKPESPVFNIGVVSSLGQNVSIKRAGYSFDGWQYCVLNSNGTPVLKDSAGNVLNVLENGTADIKDSNGRQLSETDKRFTAEAGGEYAFKNGNLIVHEGEHIYLAATWSMDAVLEYRLVTDTPITGADGSTTYKTGDVIHTEVFDFNPKALYADRSPQEFDTHSYIHLYYDEQCTKPVEENASIAKNTDGKNTVVYAKYLEGKDWTTVRSGSDFTKMLSARSGRFYFPYDIDCAKSTYFLQTDATKTFNGQIYGNGFTVRNINVGSSMAQQLSNGTTASLFGNLGAEAEINGLTIENVSVKVTLRGPASVYALFSSVAAGAQFNEFKVNGYTLNINAGDLRIENIQKIGGSYQTDNWLYGTTMDGEFVSKYGEVVQNATLIIDNEQVTGGQQ